MEWSGVERNGVERNGMKWNGMDTTRVQTGGMERNERRTRAVHSTQQGVRQLAHMCEANFLSV